LALCMSMTPIIMNVVVPQLKEDHKKWSYYADVAGGGLPPEFYFGKPVTIENHIESTSELFAVLDAQVNDSESKEIIDHGIDSSDKPSLLLSDAEPN